MLKRISFGLTGVFVLFSATFARADGDLFWCNREDYLAYDYRSALHDKGTGHELRIVKFGEKSKPVSQTAISIPDGQVHGLECGIHEITLTQYEDIPTSGYMEHHVDLNATTPRLLPSPRKLDSFKGTAVPSFAWPTMDSRGLPAEKIDLVPGKYELLFKRIIPAKCKINVTVFLHNSSNSSSVDYKIIEFIKPTECGE